MRRTLLQVLSSNKVASRFDSLLMPGFPALPTIRNFQDAGRAFHTGRCHLKDSVTNCWELDENAMADKIGHDWRNPEAYDDEDGSVVDW